MHGIKIDRSDQGANFIKSKINIPNQESLFPTIVHYNTEYNTVLTSCCSHLNFTYNDIFEFFVMKMLPLLLFFNPNDLFVAQYTKLIASFNETAYEMEQWHARSSWINPNSKHHYRKFLVTTGMITIAGLRTVCELQGGSRLIRPNLTGQ